MSRSALWRVTLVALAVAPHADAAAVRILRAQSADSFLRGEMTGVSVDAAGVLALAAGADKIAGLEEPFAFALVSTKGGWAVGTGHDGRVLTIAPDGTTKVAFDAPEPAVFALHSDSDGTLFAGTSPGGKLYRIYEQGIDEKGSEVWFDPPETYIWAIARAGDGALYVATGLPGKLYRVDGKERAELVWDGDATHVRTLLPLANGELLLGTAGDGRVLRLRGKSVRTVYDSELTEVVALAEGRDGSVWIALVASEASFVDLGARPAVDRNSTDEPKPVVTVEEESSFGSRPPGTQGAKSELVRLLPSGVVESVWSTSDETLFALAAEGERVWAATGLEGKLYRIDDGRARVERDFEEKQLVGLAVDAERRSSAPVVLTTSGAALWRLGARHETAGVYTSPALDAGQLARFGLFRWSGELPRGASVKASFRSGFSAEPDATWTGWSAPRELSPGSEAELESIERGRFIQFRLELGGSESAGPRITAIELSYQQQNLRPTIASFGALEPGQIQVPSGFNPADQLYEPASPNREGIFDTLRPTPAKGDRLKSVWRRGWLTLRWEASDPNGDELRYRLEVRPEAQPEGWLELADEIEETQWPFDATALPDGRYRFRLSASDERGNGSPAEALSVLRESEPVVVDNSPPVLDEVKRAGGEIRASVSDAWNPIRKAEVSIDGGDWRAALAADGLLDGRSEELRVTEVPKGAKLVLLRLIDAAWNVRTVSLLPESGS